MDTQTENPNHLINNFGEIEAKKLVVENYIVNKLINGEPVTVYHQMHSANDFDGVQEHGLKGNFPIKANNRDYHVAYFTLIFPTSNDGRQIKCNLNEETSQKLRLYDARENQKNKKELIAEGYDGMIETAGVFVPLGQHYMVSIFDGQSLAGKFQKI